MFTERLAKICESLEVTFHYNTKIEGIRIEAGKVAGVATSRGELKADAYVAAMGSYSPLMLKTIGIGVPVYPIKGYSLTVPITNAALAPVSTVMDETYKVATTRLGDRIRVGGTAEIAGYDTTLRPERRGPLDRSLRDLFPEAGDAGQGQLLVRAQADDARRHASPRTLGQVSQPVPQHRPRHARLDHGRRFGPRACRPHLRPPARDRGFRSVAVALRLVGAVSMRRRARVLPCAVLPQK
jgi:hypothetical protein